MIIRYSGCKLRSVAPLPATLMMRLVLRTVCCFMDACYQFERDFCSFWTIMTLRKCFVRQNQSSRNRLYTMNRWAHFLARARPAFCIRSQSASLPPPHHPVSELKSRQDFSRFMYPRPVESTAGATCTGGSVSQRLYECTVWNSKSFGRCNLKNVDLSLLNYLWVIFVCCALIGIVTLCIWKLLSVSEC
jgi:hypothetical protein